jgi:hypothetical protein
LAQKLATERAEIRSRHFALREGYEALGGGGALLLGGTPFVMNTAKPETFSASARHYFRKVGIDLVLHEDRASKTLALVSRGGR